MPVVEREHKQVKLLQPKNLILAVVGVLAIVAIAITANVQLARTTCSNPFARSILTEAAKYLDQSKQQQLQPVVAKIRAKRNFDKDPNCMYVVVSYDIFSSSIVSARADLNKLKKIHGANQGFDSALGKTESIATLESYVKVLERAATGDTIQTTSEPNL